MAGLIDLRDIFFVEADELLSALEEGLRAIQTGAHDTDTVNAVFRAVHSIKGGAGAFDLKALVGFAHRFETVLDALRAGKLQPEPALLGGLLHASDHLADMISAARQGNATDPEHDERVIAALEQHAGGGGSKEEEAFVFEPLALDGPFGIDAVRLPLPSGTRDVTLTFRPHAGAFASGHDPCLLLRDLCADDPAEVCLDQSALPDANSFDPGQSYLGWKVILQTERTDPQLLAIFEFIDGICDLTIASAAPPIPDVAASLPPPSSPPLAPVPSAPPIPANTAPAQTSAPPAAAVSPAAGTGPRPTIRVDIDRVDRLVDILGELVIHQAMLTEAIEQSPGFGSVEVDRSLDQLRQLSRQIQESVMAIRAQPVKPLFDRMHRIVREASMAAGKAARLVTEGEATEVDKTIIERLADPLTHMIRNAVDHGLEKPSRRTDLGKPSEGVIKLAAAHRSGRIVITVQDDGAGIDREKVRQIAIDKGLVAASAELTPQEIDALLFLPGFSTATEVSALSGRGVGMDVVRSEIAGLGGRVGITSVRGLGTTLTISLPLTLAVLDGMVFVAAGQTLVLPVSAIIETLRPEPGMRHSLGQADSVLDVRGRCMPLIDVGMALGFRRSLQPGEGEIVVVVERGDDGAIALMVDGIRDQRQVVIKGLEANYGQIPGIAAATVLGDGSVALILDPTDLAASGQSPSRPVSPLAAE
ncbi:chemotaxis protein CheA [Pseudorhodobacter sp. MZDSW-24AT]|uniref:chemotaxis protein CheA n=1 Tax=Pseudorhodobacter sp. MZDSW-24AT TaxID=2052957 RepID=UPI000C1EA0EC|nr:chemotaxis protein CheA [Pseudorhodobacter sp. MZDSW-24AT]PJF11143.1 chemotaxis protein CheA [Pseudorhodobacter sp. MZDSW-24AT]